MGSVLRALLCQHLAVARAQPVPHTVLKVLGGLGFLSPPGEKGGAGPGQSLLWAEGALEQRGLVSVHLCGLAVGGHPRETHTCQPQEGIWEKQNPNREATAVRELGALTLFRPRCLF